MEELETAGRDDLIRQGMQLKDVKHRLELDMRYGNQLVQTTVISSVNRIKNMDEVMNLIKQFSIDYGNRFGKGSEAPEAGIRINTVRVLSYVELETVEFNNIAPTGLKKKLPASFETRDCYFTDVKAPVKTAMYEIGQLEAGHMVDGPAVVTSPVTTYLVEPGWQLEIGEYGAAWFTRTGVANVHERTSTAASRQKVVA